MVNVKLATTRRMVSATAFTCIGRTSRFQGGGTFNGCFPALTSAIVSQSCRSVLVPISDSARSLLMYSIVGAGLPTAASVPLSHALGAGGVPSPRSSPIVQFHVHVLHLVVRGSSL